MGLLSRRWRGYGDPAVLNAGIAEHLIGQLHGTNFPLFVNTYSLIANRRRIKAAGVQL